MIFKSCNNWQIHIHIYRSINTLIENVAPECCIYISWEYFNGSFQSSWFPLCVPSSHQVRVVQILSCARRISRFLLLSNLRCIDVTTNHASGIRACSVPLGESIGICARHIDFRAKLHRGVGNVRSTPEISVFISSRQLFPRKIHPDFKLTTGFR